MGTNFSVPDNKTIPFWWGDTRVADWPDMVDEIKRRRRNSTRDIHPTNPISDGLYDLPLGEVSPVQQKRAEKILRGYVYSEESTVDSSILEDIGLKISLSEAIAEVRSKGGAPPQDELLNEREDKHEYYDNRAKEHARDKIRDRIDDIDAGDADALVDDIRTEFGAEFVSQAVADARRLEAEPEPVPEPDTPATPDTAESSPTVEYTGRPTAATDGGTEPDRDAADTEPVSVAPAWVRKVPDRFQSVAAAVATITRGLRGRSPAREKYRGTQS